MYEARFLGGASLRLDGAPVTGPASQRHPLALLAILSASPVGEVSRDKLIALLWPERDARHGRHLLSEALYVVRTAVGRDAVRAVGAGLALDGDLLWADVRTFLSAVDVGNHAAAVEVYGGEFLDGFHLPDDGEFRHWADARRLELASRYAEAIDALADGAAESGNDLEAAHWLRLRLARDPFSGSSAHRLMTALVRAGDRAEAIRVGRDYERRLRDDMGLPPAEEVTLLRARLEGPGWIEPAPRASPVEAGTRPLRSRWSTRRRQDRIAVGVGMSSPDGVPTPQRYVAEMVPRHGEVGRSPDRRSGDRRCWDRRSADRRSGKRGSDGRSHVLGAWSAPLVLALGAVLLLGINLSPRRLGLPGDVTAHTVVVLPFSSCCDPVLESEAERFAVSLTDTLARIPGHVPLDPGRVLAAWHQARPAKEGAPVELEGLAARLGARRYVTGSFLAMGTDEVRVELSLREIGGDGPLYVRRGSAPLPDVRTLLEDLGSGLAEYLRGEAAGSGVPRHADVDS